MSRKIKGNGKHLTFSDRVYIEQELMQGSSFRDIATGLGKDPSTISKSVINLHSSKYSLHSSSNFLILSLLISPSSASSSRSTFKSSIFSSKTEQ